MAKKKRQRISYVLPLASTPGGHRLGINALSFDHDRDILYTGGRDGVICAWDLNLNAEYAKQEVKNLPVSRTTAGFRRQVQAHTHWVNDLVLVKNNLAVVSASSDASVKLWRPHSHDATTAYSIGSHSDYIKCLTTPDRSSNWVASGGLDHRIRLWDLGGNGQTLEINIKEADNAVKGSVYALKARGSVIASGGPENVVRLWDTSSGKGITKLVGHTDNVRDILMSDDGDTILTASSDQTIKVWSMAAGRCIHTLTMHNDSVWCMYSDDPTLSVFYSGDKSGLVAKTDTRRAMEIDDGVSVAVCQEHDGIARLAITGDSIWTATSNSSINRWLDVDTEMEVETPPASPTFQRRPSGLSRSIQADSPPEPSSPLLNGENTTNGNDGPNGIDGRLPRRIPHNAVLRLSNTAIYPGRKFERNYSTTNLRKASEAIMEPDLIFIIPIRGHPEETIEGQNGLTKHVMLNDKKRVLTLDTSGEVVLWDLLKCIPIKSFGRKHLDEVVPGVNTIESVANWCTVDTKTGKLTVMLEENYAFDAEVYADEIDIPEQIEFREDQRNEEMRRDEGFRRSLQAPPPPAPAPPPPTPPPSTQSQQPTTTPAGISRLGAPTRILMPPSQGATPMVSPGTVITPRATYGGYPAYTPGLAIGLATPGGAPSTTYSPMSHPALSPTLEEGNDLEQRLSAANQPSHNLTKDYFSTNTYLPAPTEASSEAGQSDTTPAPTESVQTPTSPNDEKKKTMFGKKFQMTFPKKLGRTTAEVTKSTAATTEDRSEESDRSSEKEEPVTMAFDDKLFGVIQKIRQQYQEHQNTGSDQPLPVGITPSLPIETPVLKPPPHTLIIIHEDNPESGGLADQYRGEISELGKEADTLERIAPAWLGELLLHNELPQKETVKVSFILLPFEDQLPALQNPAEGSARLNANRMLRAKKIVAYICERIEAPTPLAPAPAQPTAREHDKDGNNPFASPEDVNAEPTPPPPPPLKPEEYLELICQGQKVDPNMTLATLRVHVWRTGGDVVLYYRANGRKQIKLPHPVEVAGRDEGMGTQVTSAP